MHAWTIDDCLHGDARVCRYGGAAVFVGVFMFVVPNRRCGVYLGFYGSNKKKIKEQIIKTLSMRKLVMVYKHGRL